MKALILLGVKRFEQKRNIQRFMDEAGINQSELAARVGISCATVSKTLNGTQHSPPVLDFLLEIGVPRSLLFDPRETREA
jgi:transcriptional regulator with XRE-family HTH domain